MKELYQDMIIEVLLLQQEDIVTASANAFDDATEDIFTPKGEGYQGS